MKLSTKLLAVGIALGVTTTANAADHQDGDAVKMDPSTDINDVFAFPSATNIVLSMTVSPFADKAASKFSNAAYYIFHTASYPSFGGSPTGNVDVICSFDNNQKISCWVGEADFVTGTASTETGLKSKSGMVKVFAGVRADPFYFYLTGFKNARTAVLGAIGSATPPTLYASGCPQLGAATVTALQTALTTNVQANNDFAAANVLGLTIEIDQSLLTKNPGEVVSVWASTNQKN